MLRCVFCLCDVVLPRRADIAARLPGRPETAVKNKFYAFVRKETRHEQREKKKSRSPVSRRPGEPRPFELLVRALGARDRQGGERQDGRERQ